MQLSAIPRFLDDSSYSAETMRLQHEDILAPGCFGRNDFKGTFSAGMTFAFTGGDAAIRSAQTFRDGLYRVYHSNVPPLTVTLDNGDANPRIDQIVLRVYDNFNDSSGFNKCELEAIKGTATAAADLDNRNGAAPLSGLSGAKSALLLADVLVDASASSSASNKIRDRRAFGWQGVHPPIFSDIDQLEVIYPHTMYRGTLEMNGTLHNGRHSAVLAYVPRRIVGATRIRWGFRQDTGTALTGNYVWSIFDATGRNIVSTASTAWSGTVGQLQRKSDPITATTFEAGYYWFLFGANGLNGAGKALTTGASGDTGTSGSDGRVTPFVNQLVQATPNNLTIPPTILGYTDAATAQGAFIGVPVCSLSVG